MAKDGMQAMRATYAAGYLTALETVAAETGDQNTRALCQKLRAKAEAVYADAMGRLPEEPSAVKTREEYDRDFSSGFLTHLADPRSPLGAAVRGQR